MQKEFKQLLSGIDKWVKANKGNVSFIGSFVSFDPKKIERDEEDITKDNIMIGYGGKEEVKIQLEELVKQSKKDKSKFINW